MSREIKFRAWNTSTKKMHPVNQITFPGGGTWSVENGHGVSMEYQPHIILMQYTGLKDKNGKEIYEGDIVRGQYTHYDPCQDSDVEDERMGGVVFYDSHCYSLKVIESLCDKEREGMVNYFNFFD